MPTGNSIRNSSFRLPYLQRGAAILALFLIVFVAALAALYPSLSDQGIRLDRDQKTAEALAQAKAALIGYALKVDLSTSARPGDLPCPDIDNNGTADGACSAASANNPLLGRLPWKTLGIEELRDGNGETLWYAVSTNFKNNVRTACTSPDVGGCLNSDALGTITLRRNSGAIVHDSTVGTGAIALVIAPGAALIRQDSVSIQDRSCTVGVNCDGRYRCTTSPASATPLCNAMNYLDIALGEDNANFVDLNTNGLIQGPIMDINGNTILNDQMVAISVDELVPAMERRVGREVLNCMTAYVNANTYNNNRFPYSAQVIVGAGNPNYSDSSAVTFGRVPDVFFTRTQTDGTYTTSFGGIFSPPLSFPTLSSTWPVDCNISSSGGWWLNWKEQVFYAVASAYRPAPAYTGTFFTANPASCGSCLSVNNPNAQSNRQFVVIVAGKMLVGQSRTGNAAKNTLSNYLEGENLNGDTVYLQQASTTNFNDRLYYYPQ
jgi:hypothetical protein